jgi:hypothetical protein
MERLADISSSGENSHVIRVFDSDWLMSRISREPFGNFRERSSVFLERFFQTTGKVMDGFGEHVRVDVLPSLRRTSSDALCFTLRGSMWSKSKI